MDVSETCVIRIYTGHGEECDMKWTVRIDSLKYADTVDAISRVFPDQAITAFEYEDEDGDRITVRDDEDVTAMISYHRHSLQEAVRVGAAPPVLVIYPRAEKPAPARNVHGLKIHTDNPSPRRIMAPLPPGHSAKKPSESIRTILASGKIRQTDLELLSVLGSGNGGAVYQAVHRPTGTIVAVKEITLDVSPEVQSQILAELDILYKCDSPLIIGFYGAFFVESRISMCTEFMDGGSLDRYGRIEEEYLGRIVVAVVRGLQYLWSMKVMHRDVKPSNMLINSSGEVKLCDFGVSIQLVNSIAKSYVGTNAYMAPERLKGEDYSVHSEVWSLGVSLYEMATGHRPFEGDTPVILMNKILSQPPPPLSASEFSQPFSHFVHECLQKLPHNRPSPNNLLAHALVRMYDDGRTDTLSAWVHARQTQLSRRS